MSPFIIYLTLTNSNLNHCSNQTSLVKVDVKVVVPNTSSIRLQRIPEYFKPEQCRSLDYISTRMGRCTLEFLEFLFKYILKEEGNPAVQSRIVNAATLTDAEKAAKVDGNVLTVIYFLPTNKTEESHALLMLFPTTPASLKPNMIFMQHESTDTRKPLKPAVLSAIGPLTEKIPSLLDDFKEQYESEVMSNLSVN